MAKRYDHKTLTDAIKQGQARMKESMGSAYKAPEPVRHGTRMPLERPRPQAPAMMKKLPRTKIKFKIKPDWKKIGIAAGVIGLAAVVVWFGGRHSPQPPAGPADTGTAVIIPPARTDAALPRAETVIPKPRKPAPAPEAAPSVPSVSPPTQGDHVIVIATYVKREHLEPVQGYFKEKGVETEIMRRGSYYLLVTKDRFESTERVGADGFEMKQRIKNIGQNYKAPSGYENFGRTPFQDVYGMKITN